jgi:putative spermidine/putrescine transport system substrate-binding protein
MNFGAVARARTFRAAGLFCILMSSVPAYAQQADDTVLNVASLGGQLDQVFKAAFKPFEEQHHVTIHWTPGVAAENVAKVAASKNSPEFDVALLESLGHEVGSKQHLWAPVDQSIVTNYKDLVPHARPKNNDGVGIGIYLAGFFYNPVEFEKRHWAPPKSWNDMFRPEFCGHIGIMHPNVSYTLHTILMLSGGDPAHFNDGIAKLAKLKDCIPVLEPSAPKLEEKAQLGEYLVGIHGNIRVGYLIKRGYPIRFVYPEEGTVEAYSVVAAVNNAPHPKLAQEFMNWFISPDVEKQVMEGLYYGPTNIKIKVPEDLVQYGVPDAAVMKKMVYIEESTIVDRRRDWVRQTERALAK